MLHFFRTHQKYFFVMVTFVIVISFSFFGTYGAIDPTGNRDQIAFTAIDGTAVKRSDVEELVSFISTDSEDKLLFGGSWGPNFLNNGVLNKDFLQTGLASILAEQYRDDISQDYVARHEKEKKFHFYQHPQADFINLDAAWAYFAPAMRNNIDTLVKSAEPLDPAAFDARVNLFVAERRIPPSTVKQILRFQEKQYNWITPDPQLQYIDLSLFGYHTFEDWFGPRFTRLLAEFIINSAKVAHNKGYRVSKEEALADLMRNSEISFQQNSKNPALAVANSSEYFHEQLRRLNMDPANAARVWSQVMLFRELFHDAGSAAFVDTFAFTKVNGYVNEEASGDIYQLAPEFRLGNGEDLRKFEAYVAAVSKKDEKNPLSPPKAYLSVDEVKKTTPELVQKKYTIEVAQADTKQLEGRVSLRETWNWEAEEKNWTLLTVEFPELGAKSAKTREERIATLDRLDDKTRARVDAYTREKIIASHPEWIENSLAQANRKTQTIIIRQKGGKSPLLGVKDPLVLMKQLDDATIGTEFTFSPDQQRYYAIKVTERSPKLELSTYADAVRGGIFDDLAKKKITDEQLEKTVAALKAEAEKAKLLKPGQAFTSDSAASYRLYSYMKASLEQLKKNPEASATLVKDSSASKVPGNQFLLEKAHYSLTRHDTDERFDSKDLFALADGSWTVVNTPPNGDLYFFQLISRSVDANEGVSEKISQVRKLLSDSVQKTMMKELVARLKKANALSLSYLDTGPEMDAYEPPAIDEQQDG